MILSAQIEQQLTTMAAAVDRANKPTSLLLVPMLLVVASLGFVLWGWREMSSQRALVSARVREVDEITKLVGQIQNERGKSVDIASLYIRLPFMGSQVSEAWTGTGITFREPPIVGSTSTNPILSNPVLLRSEVQVTTNNEPLENILKGVDATLRHEVLGPQAFVSLAQLTPAGGGWRSTIRFSAYHVPAN